MKQQRDWAAIVERDRRIEYKQFCADVAKSREGFQVYGIDSSSRVLLKMNNSYNYCLAFFSLASLGCSIVLADAQTPRSDLRMTVQQSKVDFIVSDSSSKWFVFNEIVFKRRDAPPFTGEPPEIDLSQWLARDDALILLSSGTTGTPKGILHKGESLLQNIQQTQQVMKYQEDDLLLPLIPFSHFYGLSILLLWWYTGCSLFIFNYQQLRSIFRTVIEYGITVVDASPSTYYALMDLLAKREEWVERLHTQSKVRMWCVGGAPLSLELSKRFRQWMKKPLLDGYGMSEVGNVALNVDDSHWGCGKPVPGVEVRIEKESSGTDSLQEQGEIWVKSPSCMTGYLNDESLTQSVLQDGWFKTGDLGYFDPKGHLHVIGRKGTAINRMGYLFYPSSVENRLEDVGIKSKLFSFDDERKGSFLVLAVENSNDTDIMQLRKRINKQLQDYMYPDLFVCFDQFPLNRNGKVDQRVLAEKVKDRINQINGRKFIETDSAKSLHESNS